jgi:hypothetical protein
VSDSYEIWEPRVDPLELLRRTPRAAVSDFYEVWGRDGQPGTAPLELLWRAPRTVAAREEAEKVMEDCRTRGYSDLQLREVEG